MVSRMRPLFLRHSVPLLLLCLLAGCASPHSKRVSETSKSTQGVTKKSSEHTQDKAQAPDGSVRKKQPARHPFNGNNAAGPEMEIRTSDELVPVIGRDTGFRLF